MLQADFEKEGISDPSSSVPSLELVALQAQCKQLQKLIQILLAPGQASAAAQSEASDAQQRTDYLQTTAP